MTKQTEYHVNWLSHGLPVRATILAASLSRIVNHGDADVWVVVRTIR